MLAHLLVSFTLSAPLAGGGAERLLASASALEASSSDSLAKQIEAQAWLAITRTLLNNDPPQGPPDTALTSALLIEAWGVACVEAAAALPASEATSTSAFAQVNEVARLLILASPSGASRTLVFGGELALAQNDHDRAKNVANHAGNLVDWKANPSGSGNGSLASLLGALGECELLARLGTNVSRADRALVAAAAAAQPACEATFKTLLAHDDLTSTEGAARLLYELHQTSSSHAAALLAQRMPALIDIPALRLLLAETLFRGGDLEGGMKTLGGPDALAAFRGREQANLALARAVGMARNGDAKAARETIPRIGGIDNRFFAAIETDSRLLDRGELEPADVLKDFATLRAVRTAGLDPFLGSIAAHPTRLDRVVKATIASGRWELMATLLTPIFQAKGQSGDDWLERRLACLARGLAASGTVSPAAWSSLVEAVARLDRVDSQVQALCTLAAWWHSLQGDAPLPDAMRSTLQSTLESIAVAPQP